VTIVENENKGGPKPIIDPDIIADLLSFFPQLIHLYQMQLTELLSFAVNRRSIFIFPSCWDY